ncbi:MAG TPA: type II toxin-antitoxin system VapC family toxin [Chloroflexota bacterium]|nr:type II toxin-antitoxin system VapC family toxin [Chloroflexota bacterium]
MKRYLLDTALLAAYFYNRRAAVDIVSPWILAGEAATSILVYGELIEHLKRLPDFMRRRVELRELLREIAPYFLTYSIMERYAELRRQLRPPHGPGLIGDVDTLIAATALERGLVLVTTDTDFERVPGLELTRIPRGTLQTQ